VSKEFYNIVVRIAENDPRYKEDAYIFVMEALSYTQKKFNAQRHLSGEEILSGMRELLIEKYGPMTMTVLKHWGIKNTEDFGNVVFNLVESRVLSKTEEDSLVLVRLPTSRWIFTRTAPVTPAVETTWI